MIPIFLSSEAKQTDTEISDGFGIPATVLMENVGKEISLSIINKYGTHTGKSVIILCGGGNNGGDGFVIARNLQSYFDVKVVSIGSSDKMSPETAMNYECCRKMSGSSFLEPKDEFDILQIDFQCDIMIDALIGIRSTENIRGLTEVILKKISNNKATKIAVDVPTGLNTDTGSKNEYAFKADEIYTAFGMKAGFFLNAGEKIPEIHVVDVGIPQAIVKRFADKFSLEYDDYKNSFPKFSRQSSKFDFGQVSILAGSSRYPGAAALCANAAISAGAGLVRLYSTDFHSCIMPEIIRMRLKADEEGYISIENAEYLSEQLAKSDAVAVGPGLGNKPDTVKLVNLIIASLPVGTPLIVDADALRAIDLDRPLGKNVIITPHIGEFARLTGLGGQEISEKRTILPRQLAKRLNCIVHLKGNPSVSSDGATDFWTVNGSNALSTAGSGDVLTGITATYCGMGIKPLTAIASAAYAHARTAEIYSQKYSSRSFKASDIYENLKII